MSILSAVGRAPSGARLERMRRSPRFVGGRFVDPLPQRMDSPPRMLAQWLFAPSVHRSPDGPVPIVTRSAAEFAEPRAGLRITWFGHSSFLLELDGCRVLVDPVWGEYASPGAFFGVRRFFPPPIPLAELPPIDVVIISHDHYDHLNEPTIRAFAAMAATPRFVTSLGVGAHLEAWGVAASQIIELDWWDDLVHGPLRITAAPARHFSGRLPWGRNRTLWSSWVVAGASQRVFAGADSGFFPGFAEIGRRLGPFDASILEIGAYGQGWPDIHLGPEQAVAAHLALGGGLLVPAHWATFALAMHGWTEPAERLMVAASSADVRFVMPRPGESIDPRAPQQVERWWPELPWSPAADSPIIAAGFD